MERKLTVCATKDCLDRTHVTILGCVKGLKENKDEQITSISKAQTLEEIADYWDTHSLADHWDETHEVNFEVRMQRKCRVTLTPEIYEKIEKQALEQGILPETLVNLWLAERLQAIESS